LATSENPLCVGCLLRQGCKMLIQTLLGTTNKRNSGNAGLDTSILAAATAPVVPADPTPPEVSGEGDKERELARLLNENLNHQIKEAHARVQQQQRERRRPPRRQTGSVRLSNTDSIGHARRIRARLLAKLQEVYGSDMQSRSRGAAAMDIKLQIDRVDRQIAAIRRRERALEEERTTRRDDSPEARRRRARDIQQRSIGVRRDFLYHASRGGFDPNNVLFNKTGLQNPVSSVAFDIGGKVGTMDIAAADAGLEVDFNMEVVL